MTTPFKSPMPGIALMALGALSAAPVSTYECANEAAGLFTSKNLLVELTRHLVSQPSDEAALSAVCVAVREGGQVQELVALLESWSNTGRADNLPPHAVAEVAFRIAKGSTGAHARELCRTGLDLYPVHVAALSLFEELADASWTDELCARYQVFLEDAPLHGVSPDICEAVTRKLLEAERASSRLLAEATLNRKDRDDVHLSIQA